MTEIVLFHHAQGLTPGIVAFADELRRAGHTVHTPDLYDGHTFDTLEEGVGYAGKIGFETITDHAVRAAEELPATVVYAGFSLGVGPAQKLAQTQAGARGALLFSACFRRSEFGSSWPDGVPVQIHAMDTTRSSTTGGTSPPPARSSTRPQPRSCFSIPATSTSSPTVPCRLTTRMPPRW